MSSTAFYCVCDARYFLGAVAMINSLRLQGHDEPVYVLDCGLEPAQRELLAGETTIVEAPADTPPFLAKTVAPLSHPAETMVLIDADMIVTRSLAELTSRAAEGAVVAFENDTQRFVAAWGELLGVGDSRPRPYVSSSLVLLGGAEGAHVLQLLDDRQRRVDFDQTYYRRNDPAYPFRFPEQDVLNAILSTRPDDDAFVALEHRLAPNQPFAGLQLVDQRSLRCEYGDGTAPFVLHHYLRKPWLEPMYHGIYSRLLARLLLAEGVAISVPAEQVPLRFHDGALAWLERKRIDIPDLIGWRARGLLPAAVTARLDERRRRRLAPPA